MLQFVFLRKFISSKTLTLPSDCLVSLFLHSVDGTYFVLILFGSEVYLILFFFFVMCLCRL